MIDALIIGSNGLVGNYLSREFERNDVNWLGTFNKRVSLNAIRLDITKESDLENIRSLKPKAVFHCANLAGGVDFCESNPKVARKFHVEATQNIVDICQDIGAKLVFISSDYVFDGQVSPYLEDDETNPLNLYGKLKQEAEDFIRHNLIKNHLIIRTTNIFGWDPTTVTPNFVMNMFNTLKEGKRFNAPSFLWGNPTYAGDLVKAIFELYKKSANGTYHIVGSSYINRFDWARLSAKAFGFDQRLVEVVQKPSEKMIPRPLKSCLSADKFTANFDTELHGVDEGLELMLFDKRQYERNQK